MKYTENYHLPQWVESDRIMMEDFNQMCANIESGMTENRAAARTAQTEAAEKGFVIGSYVGTGTKMENGGQMVELGFRPRFLMITRGWMGSSGSDYFLAVGEHPVSNQGMVFSMEDTGFRVATTGSSGPLALNNRGTTYDYIAFK